MRVGIDASGAITPWTGIGRYTEELIRALFRRPGIELRLLANDFGGAVPPIVVETGLPVSNPRAPTRLLRAAWRWLDWPPVERLVGPIDVFHWSDWIHPPVRRAAVVGTIHDMGPLVHPEWYAPEIVAIHRARNQGLADRADAIIAVSGFTRGEFLKLFDVEADRVHAVRSGVSGAFTPARPDEVAGVRARFGLERPYLLYVGTREARKNVSGLIEIFGLLAAELPELELVLVGMRPWAEARAVHGVEAWSGSEIEDRIAALGLDSRVRIPGRVEREELRALYSGASCLVFPSYYEGFGFPAVEAMACGAPVVVSSAGALPEVVGSAGRTADPDDHEAFATGILEVLRDPELAADLGKRGRERAGALTWAETARATEEVYRKVRQE